jgi:hypothetical protein
LYRFTNCFGGLGISMGVICALLGFSVNFLGLCVVLPSLIGLIRRGDPEPYTLSPCPNPKPKP